MENEDLAELEPLTRLFFIYLWMLADREGRVEDRPKKLKAKALPYDINVDADVMLNDLQSGGFLVRYEADGGKYIQILTFSKHQKPHSNESQSVIPPWKDGLSTMVQSSFDHDGEDCESGSEALGPCISDSLIDRLTENEGDKSPSAPSGKVSLSADGEWVGISDPLMAKWKQAYPALSLDAELSKAAAWIIANPKNKKSNYARFLTNWLARAQDKAPKQGGGNDQGNTPRLVL